MIWTDAQKEFLFADESTLFLGGRQVGKTKVLVRKARNLLDDGHSVTVIVSGAAMARQIENKLGSNVRMELIWSPDRVCGLRGGIYLIDEYSFCTDPIHRLTGTIFATTTRYPHNVGQFENCVTSFGDCHFHNSDYLRNDGGNSRIEHYGTPYNGHMINFVNRGGYIEGECSICGEMNTHRESYYVTVMAMFNEACPYTEIGS